MKRNNGKYDLIYRDDEENIETQTYSNINYPSLVHCTGPGPRWYMYGMMHVRSSGIMLGQQCLWNYEWCRNENTGHYSTGYFTEINKEIFQEKRNYSEALSQHINTNNPQLCSNNTFWKQHSCTLHDKRGKVRTYGHRCTGSVQQCVLPWFTWKRGEDIGGW